MEIQVFRGILIPFLGTALGSACVLFMKNTFNSLLQRALTGFAAGVMVAASIWSLFGSGHGAVSFDGTMGICTRHSWILDWYSLFAAFRQNNSASAYE